MKHTEKVKRRKGEKVKTWNDRAAGGGEGSIVFALLDEVEKEKGKKRKSKKGKAVYAAGPGVGGDGDGLRG